ncbi:MAG: signal peptidase I [Pseudohongiellaceae bacterium]
MDIDFSLVLFVLVLISGIIWLFDALVLAKPRSKKLEMFVNSTEMSKADIEAALEAEQDSKIPARQKQIIEQVFKLQREPVAVEYAKSFFPVLFAVLLIRSFLFEPFQIPTGSMIPTLNVGDFIVVNKYAYGLRLPVLGTKILEVDEPQRGDIMVFIPPHDPSYFIKRVIGLPGDHIRYEDKVLYINGEPMEQEFVAFLRNESVIYSIEQLGDLEHDIYTAPSPRFLGTDYWLKPEGSVVPDGHYYMMGDNRDNSDDSRRWGPVPEDNIVGKAVAVWMHKEPGLNLPTFDQNRLLNRE